jgi:hypothetical protein
MHELPDVYLADPMVVAKKIATAQGLENYNILQVCFQSLLAFLPASRSQSSPCSHHWLPPPNPSFSYLTNPSHYCY